MNTNESNESNIRSSGNEELQPDAQTAELPHPQPPPVSSGPEIEATSKAESEHGAEESSAEVEKKSGLDKQKMMLLGGGLAAAVLFFAFTLMLGHSPGKRAARPTRRQPSTQQQTTAKPSGGIAPMINPLRKPDPDSNDGQLTSDDIKRMRSPESTTKMLSSQRTVAPPNTPRGGDSLAAVPSFADTQQRWEEPRPYGESQNGKAQTLQQEQALLKETSIVFVKSQTQAQAGAVAPAGSAADEAFLNVTPGSRIIAKFQTEISTLDPNSVVAQVEYTYAIGDDVVLPAGAQIYGHIQQADRAGNVSVKFDEVRLLDGRKEKIAAEGKGLDLGPIKGKVYGKNTGKNLLVRSVSGLGSTMAMVFGNNTSSAFSEDDLIRERVAENIGTAGDSEVMSMALNSHEYVAVSAETRIYVVFTEREAATSGLHRATP